MGRDTLEFVTLHRRDLYAALLSAYSLGRENENREKRGIPLFNVGEELQKTLDKYVKM